MRVSTPIEVLEDVDNPQVPLTIAIREDGTPIYLVEGGAPSNVDDWIPIEYDSDVVQRVMTESAIERYAVRVPMTSKTKSIPRSAGMTVTAGTTYVDDTSLNDDVILTARRFIGRFKIDEDDLADASTRLDVIETKGLDWAISYADVFDHACLAVTGVENGTTVPFTSVYKSLRTANADTGYTADANYLTWDDDLVFTADPTTGALVPGSLYVQLSATFKKVEVSKFWSLTDSLVIAHPGWRDALRMVMDNNGRPIFIQGTSGTPDTLFNVPIAWSRGSKAHATNTGNPTGGDLLFFVNRRYLRRGVRSGPETLTDDARAQDDTDDYAIKFRARRGFKLTHESAAAVLERVSD